MTDGPNTFVDRTFRGFRCDAPAGEGPRAWVFQGSQIALDRPVALKILKPDVSANERRLFLGAVRAAASLVHSRVVPIINVVEEEDAVVVASEWVPSPTLTARLVAHGPLSQEDACRLATDVMDAVHALHLTNRGHGNLVPGNVFVDGEGRGRVSDFFLPCPSAPSRRGFAAPETANGRAPDWRSDLYAVAGLAWMAANGRLPAEGVPPVDEQTEWGRWLADWRAPDPDTRAPDLASAVKRLAEMRAAAGEGLESRDARRYRRMPANLEVEFRTWSTTPERTARFFSRMRDIGESGVFIRADHPLPVGSMIDVAFEIPGAGHKMTALGLVRWHSRPPAEPGMGVQFVETATDDREEFRTFLDVQTADELRAAARETPLHLTVVRWMPGRWGRTVTLAAAAATLLTTEKELREAFLAFERLGLVVVGETHARIMRPASAELEDAVLALAQPT